ncbi:hypothetical protein PDESU_02226 [Pontiella desulfatans]|jgi:hypothetical protein|uniref:Type I restriction endonuclease subunit M n=1 Tax=Pontiella desulfatans TaxID=2750659 RepID=A0A6C2U1I3_PONDE|nr:hypothetical protein [Pontiella desulfatans]VGO13669.1 hypothetical protein PDESU_02226 [Pontiella desulfatans]
MIMTQKPRFNTGQICSTPGALEAMMDALQSPVEFISRHISGDWGEVCAEDQQANEEAVDANLRLLSAYRTKKEVRLWVITESDRSLTTILLPEEY